jgi:hypothetical protein
MSKLFPEVDGEISTSTPIIGQQTFKSKLFPEVDQPEQTQIKSNLFPEINEPANKPAGFNVFKTPGEKIADIITRPPTKQIPKEKYRDLWSYITEPRTYMTLPSYYKWSVVDEKKTPPPTVPQLLDEMKDVSAKSFGTTVATMNPFAVGAFSAAYAGWDYMADKLGFDEPTKQLPNIAFAMLGTVPPYVVRAGFDGVKNFAKFKMVQKVDLMASSKKLNDYVESYKFFEKTPTGGMAEVPKYKSEFVKALSSKEYVAVPRWMSLKKYGNIVADGLTQSNLATVEQGFQSTAPVAPIVPGKQGIPIIPLNAPSQTIVPHETIQPVAPITATPTPIVEAGHAKTIAQPTLFKKRLEESLIAPSLGVEGNWNGPVIKVKSFGQEGYVPLIENYKGNQIVKTGDNFSVWNPKEETLFVVALDDSKSTGGRFINQEANTVEKAREYIDWVTEVRAKQTKPAISVKIIPIQKAIKDFNTKGMADIAVGKDYGIAIKDEGDYVSVRFGSNELTEVGTTPYGERNFATKEEAFNFAESLQKKVNAMPIKKAKQAKPTAVYIGMQQGVPEKGIKPFALYNIVDPQNITGNDKSTVAEARLKELGIEVPKIKPVTPPGTVKLDINKLSFLEADGEGIKEAVDITPINRISKTKGPIEVAKTINGNYVVLDGRTRTVEAYKRGEKVIGAKILSTEETLQKYGGMVPYLEGVLAPTKQSIVKPKVTPAKVTPQIQSKKITPSKPEITGLGEIFRMPESIQVTNVQGRKITLPKGEEYRVLKLSNGNIRLQDGKQVTIETKELKKLKGLEIKDTPKAGGMIHKEQPDEMPENEIDAEQERALKELDDELKKSPITNLFLAIRNLGGIYLPEKYRNAETAGIPGSLLSKDPTKNSLDTMAQELKSVYGWDFNRPEELVSAIKKIAIEQGIITVTGESTKPTYQSVRRNVDAVKLHQRQLRQRRKSAADLIDKFEKAFASKSTLPKGKVLPLIRQTTGQAKVGDLIREDIALKRMMQREQSAATIAARLGRKEGEVRHKAHAEEIQTRIDERAEERAKVRKLVSDIEKVRKNLPKMHPTEAQPIKDILESIDLVKRQKTSMMQLGKIREWLQTNPEAEMPDYIMEKLQRLDHRNLNDITTDELEAIHDTIMHYAHLNKLKNQLKFKKSDRELTQAITESVSQMKAPKKIKDEIISSSKSKFEWINKPVQWFVNMMGLGHDNYSLIVETLSGPRSVAMDVLVNQIQEGRNTQLRYQQNAPEEFQKSLGGMTNFKKRYGIKDIDKWLDEKTIKGKIEITRDEKIAIYLHSLSEDNMRHITNGGFAFEVGPHRDQVFKFSEQDVADVVKSITPVEKEYANAISEAFQREGDDIAKVFLEVNGYPMPRVEDPYFRIEPVRSTLTPTSQAKSAVEEFKNNFIRIGLNKGRLIQRTKSDLPIYLKGATKVLIQSVDWASSYIGLEKPLLNARKLMHGKGEIWKNEIIHRYGSETFKLMEEGLKDIAGSRDSLSSSEKLILWLRNNAATAMLGLPNPFPILKQMTSIPIYNIYVPAKYIIQGFVENAFKHNEIVDRHKLYSAEFTERKYGGFNREVSDIVHASSQRGQLIGGGENLKQKSMKGLQAGDLFSVVPGMHAAVLQGLAELESGKLSEYVKLAMDIEESEIPNLSATDKLKLAYKYGDWVTNHTQSTSNPLDMSSLRRAKGLTGLLTQFGSDLQAQLNLVRRLYGEARRNRDVKHWARLIYALFIIYVVTQTEETMVDVFRRKVMGYKPKKGQTLFNQLAWGLLDKPMAQMFFLRDVYQATKSKVQNGVFAGQDIQIPVARGVNVATDALAEWVKVMTEKNIAKRDKALMAALDSSAEATTLIVGIPYSTPKGIIKRFIEPEKSAKGAGKLTLPKVGKVGGAGVSLPKVGR